jgi:hypothetical protein
MTDPYLEALLEAQQQIKILIAERDEARATLREYHETRTYWEGQATVVARKQALSEALGIAQKGLAELAARPHASAMYLINAIVDEIAGLTFTNDKQL